MRSICRQIIFVLLAMGALPLAAQVNSSVFYSNDHNLENATYFPSQLGMDRSTVQVDLAGAYGYVNNTAFSFNYARRLTGQAVIQNDDISQFSERISGGNELLFGAQLRPIELSLTFNDNLSIALGSKIKSDARFSFDGTLLEVLWNGNAQFAGETVNLGSASALIEYPVEIYSSLAMSFPNWDNLKLRAGVRPKMIMSYAGFQIDHAQVTMFTEENGKYIEFDYGFLANTGLPQVNGGDFAVSRRATTFTMDLGATAVLANRFHFSGSLLDVGRLKYKKNPRNFHGAGTLTFEGAEVMALRDGVTVNDSAIVNSFEYNETQESFTTPLPARVGLQAFYRVPHEKKNGKEYNKFSAGVTLLQGLSKESTFSDNTFLSLGANYNLGGIVNIGTSFNTYNMDKWGWGLNASARLLIFHLGFGTTNLAPIFTSHSGLYTDFYISGGLNF